MAVVSWWDARTLRHVTTTFLPPQTTVHAITAAGCTYAQAENYNPGTSRTMAHARLRSPWAAVFDTNDDQYIGLKDLPISWCIWVCVLRARLQLRCSDSCNVF